MGQYKVPQNVEAEDHILGPLTFKQFIYMMIGAGWAILCFAIFKSVPIVMIVIGAPPTILFLLLAFFRRDGQDFEHLLVAIVGFFSATHYRLWVKEPLAETFHITPTKRAAEISQRNPAQVISELEKLATLIDSRGWNIPVNTDTGSHLTMPNTAHEDRLVAPAPPVANQPLQTPHTDMLDMQNSPMAQNLSALLQQSANDVRQQAMTQMAAPSAMPAAPVNGMQPANQAAPSAQSISGVTAYPTNDILRLATQSEGMSVASVAAQATRINPVVNSGIVPAQSGQMVEQQPSAS